MVQKIVRSPVMELYHTPLARWLIVFALYVIVIITFEYGAAVQCSPVINNNRHKPSASDTMSTSTPVLPIPPAPSTSFTTTSPTESPSGSAKPPTASAGRRPEHLEYGPFGSPANGDDDTAEHVGRRHRQTEDLLGSLDQFQYVVPKLVDHSGTFVSYDVTHNHHSRKKRSAKTDSPQYSDQWIYYQLSAFGMDFNLNLTLNRQLISSSYTVEYWRKSGPELRHPGRMNCHYIGHLNSDRKSRVAVSNCLGLHGMFATANEEFFVEPLWNDTRHIHRDGRFHVVYKRSAIKARHKESHCGVSEKLAKPDLPRHWWPPKSPWSFNEILKPHHHGYHHKDKWRTRRRNRRSTSVERHVETLVVVDKQMLGYHGEKAVEPYILTVMNIVARLYHDSSIGNAINIIITRLIILRDSVDQLDISYHADHSLESFCAWQQFINPFEGSESVIHQGVAHHDNAILITRYDICLYKNEPCGTLGLAPVSGMCEPRRSCSINEDIGLSSAFTIAHEIGHNFGMQHDGVGNDCGLPGNEPARIMAAQLTDNTKPFSWSSCSRKYITEFLDSGRGECLDNLPEEVDFDLPETLPGEIHGVDEQCIYQYGENSRMCKPKEVCMKLSCINHNEECVSNNIPAAEGSPCVRDNGKGGWCYRGNCERVNYTPKPVVGGWAGWSEWGSCSRTCSGGVESSSRACDSPRPKHGGKYCIGERTRYRSCNVDDCPIHVMDFRELQCERFNNLTFRGRLYKWKPFPASGHMKPCALNCLAVGFNFYTEMSQKVVDGTRCFPDTLDICINGECKEVGCDKILGSSAVEDQCRVCDGNGDSCETLAGEFTEPLPDDGDSYQEVVTIPQGAVHIKVEEIVPSRNYLALRSKDTDKYYINGAWTIDWPRKFEVANTVFHYVRPKDDTESFTAVGPISEDLIVMILLQEHNLGIRYQYNVPINNASENGTEFVWQFTAWSDCSTTCAKGVSQSTVVCIRKDDRKIVHSQYCPLHLKPKDRVRECNEEACPPAWEISPWSECSKSCGGGMKNRSALCVQKISQHYTEIIEMERCPSKEPVTSKTCNVDKCPAHWAMDGWTECHPSCGDGYKTRNVYCVSADGQYLQDQHCDEENKPKSRTKCDLPKCPPPQWVTGAWGECSAKCGLGQQRRSVACRSYSGTPSNTCEPQMRPHDSQQCEGPCEIQPGQECRDDNKVAYCPLVLKFRFCHRSYFYQMCCKTCSKHGFKVRPGE